MTDINDYFNRLDAFDPANPNKVSVWQNKLNGEWQPNWGWNFISQPKFDNRRDDDFAMRFDRMHETITFKNLGRPARNVGVTGDAGWWQGISYEISITRPNDDGGEQPEEGIHHEMGHFLLKVKDPGPRDAMDPAVNVQGETAEDDEAPIIRQAVIPRANAIMSTGTLQEGNIETAVEKARTPFFDAKPQTRGNVQLRARINSDFRAINADVQGFGGPDLEKPLEWLRDVSIGTRVGKDGVFLLRHGEDASQMASGQRVKDPVVIGKLLSDFWIGKRDINGTVHDTLQYAQRVDLRFGGVEWPHLALNTLIKQP